MKKLLAIAVIFLTASTAYAQDSEQPRRKKYRNELGLDATGFVKYILDFNQDPGPDYSPVYYLTYRRYIGPGAIRAAVGGDARKGQYISPYDNDSNEYFYRRSILNARLGWEFSTRIAKRWQAYYGADFRMSRYYDRDDAPYYNAGYANGRELESATYAAAPLLGLRFSLTPRLSLRTEASFSLNWSKADTRRYFIPTTSQYPAIEDDVQPTVKSFATYFEQPLSLFLTFDI